MRLDHINIRAPKPLVEQLRDFYCSVLGLTEGFRPDFGSPGHWLYAGKEPLVHLSVASKTREPGSPGFLDHVAFRGENLEECRHRLDSAGISYRASRVPETAMTQLFLKDPCGVGIEINFVDQGRS